MEVEISGQEKLVKVVSGDLNTIGSEICIGEECFYLISNDGAGITMFAKYNLYVGNHCTSSSTCIAYGEEATGKRDSTMAGFPNDGSYPRNGTVAFSPSNYWSSSVSSYPTYVYNSNSNLYNYIEKYKIIIENMGVTVEESRLIKQEELVSLGCSASSYSCISSFLWTYSTSYWTGSAYSSNHMWVVHGGKGGFYSYEQFLNAGCGVRPVITIPKSEF